MDEITDRIEAAAAEGIESASVDGASVTATPIPDLIEADKYLAQKAAAAGTNANGGPRSPWNQTRPAVAVYRRPL